tara:strand:+ start:528 stop:680 length:153 start_codon:yes stop_codon:yes gene_type:complete
MSKFTTIKSNPYQWTVESQQNRLGMTDKDRTKKREKLKKRRLESGNHNER